MRSCSIGCAGRACVMLLTAGSEALCDSWNQQQEVSMILKILRLVPGLRMPHRLETLFAVQHPVPVRVAARPRYASVRPLAAILAFGCAVVFGHSSAHAQVPCGPRQDLVKLLSDQYKESPVGIGLAQSGQLLEVFASSVGSWSMVMTTTDGKTCIVAAGDNWEMVTKVKGTGI